MKLSVIIPAYNEHLTLATIIERVRAVNIPKEIILVDDGSTDGTQRLYSELSGLVDKIVAFPANRGKGAAVREGLKHVTGDYVVIQDADLEYNPEEYHLLLAPLLEGKADVVYGSRFLTSRPRRVLYFWHSVGNRFLTLLSNVFTDINLSDMGTCYKMFRTDVIRALELRENRFGIEAEITAKIARMNVRIYEVGISYEGRTYHEGKKITWKDGAALAWHILRYARGRYLDVGKDTLYRLESFPEYTAWIHSKIRDAFGEHLLEIGSGAGAIAPFLRAKSIVLTDCESKYLDLLRKRYADRSEVEVAELDLDVGPSDEVRRRKIDTILCLNVLEHIRGDEQALRWMNELLQPGGRLALLVPAHPAIYNKIDENLEHCRRYTRGELIGKLREAGFEIDRAIYFNPLGALGWAAAGKFMRASRIKTQHVRLHRWLLPVAKLLDKLKLPFGISHIVIAKKPIEARADTMPVSHEPVAHRQTAESPLEI